MDYVLLTLKLIEEYYSFIIIFLVGFLITLFYTPKLIRKAREKNLVARDMYKEGKPEIPNLGGLAILVGILSSLIIAQFLIEPAISHNLLIFYFMVFTFAMFGLADDLLDVGRKSKIFIPFLLALPIVLLNQDTSIWLGFTEIELGTLYSFIIAPLYVMVVANMINMHSGYNGLSCGLSYILIVFIIIKIYMHENLTNLIYILPLFGSILAFLYFETYPAKIFWGNIGSLMVGSSIGGFLVLNSMELFGIVILIPHIINFLMYVIWKIKKIGEVKFGGLRGDGTLVVPNPWTLKWTFPYYFRLTEHRSMWILYSITMFFGILGLVLIP